MAEFGLVAPVGRNGLELLIAIITDAGDARVPKEARACLLMLVAQLRLANAQILESDRCIIASARSTEIGRRLMGIPGVGTPASAIAAPKGRDAFARFVTARLGRQATRAQPPKAATPKIRITRKPSE
jgi:hypothetical protein